MKKNAAFLIVFFIIKTVGFGQEKLFKAPLPPVPGNGFYKIDLRPEIVSFTNPDLSDLRIYDQKNIEVPYYIEHTLPERISRYFHEYPVVQKVSIPKGNTTLVIQNPERNKITNIGLLLKNTGVRKNARLSGSTDAQTWYALQDDYVLHSVANPLETSEVKVLQFPLSDYEFYKLEINDSASAPLNILAAGYYDFNAENGQYAIVPALPFTQTDSAAVKKSFLWFSEQRPVLIDKLEFDIDSATFYLRNASIFAKETVYSKRNKKITNWVKVKSFQLRSDSKNVVQMSGFRAKDFFIEIENADDQPLKIKGVKAFQLKVYLLAELKKNRTYKLLFGDEKASAPAYDLRFFKDKFPEFVPVIEPLAIAKNAKSPGRKSTLNKFFQHEVLIWLALIVVIAFLGYMTYRMLQESAPAK